MRIAVGSDHRGSTLRHKVITYLRRLGQDVVDVGVDSQNGVDYPDVAAQVARQVSGGNVERGLLICGTGLGMAIVANKFPGVRAAPCHDELMVEISRRHNDLNVLCLAADAIGEVLANRLIDVWLRTEFEGGRHARRLKKITQLESNGFHQKR
jgi:ribose 5-phosphate isomerase B